MTPADRETPTSAAAGWLIRRQAGLSPQDDAAFAAWLARSEAHRTAWARAEATWAAVDAEDDPLLDAMRADALRARPERRPAFARWAMAAAVVVVVAAAVTWRVVGQAPMDYAATSESKVLALADGSQVTLDPATRIEVTFTGRRRDLHLMRGRAVFEVRHEGRPFAVQAGDVTVTATGTRFSVQTAADWVSATLERGAVVVTRELDPRRVTLAPGQTLVAAKGAPMRLSQATRQEAATPPKRFVEFRDTPLAEAAAEISQRSGTPIHVIGAAKVLKLSGRFRGDDPKGFAAAVSQILPVRQRSSADGGLELSEKPGR